MIGRPRVACVGAGVTEFARHGASAKPERRLLLQAIVAACDDAGIDPRDIDGFSTYGHDLNEAPQLVEPLGCRELRWSTLVHGGGGGGSAPAIAAAEAAIVSGQAEVMVVYRAITGRVSNVMGAAHYGPHHLPHGVIAPAQSCALRTTRMLEAAGVPRSALRAVVLADYHHAQNNPNARAYGQPLSEEDYETSRFIAEPYRLYDCSRENDVAAALILTSAERARDTRKPVPVLASAQGAPAGWGENLHNDLDYLSAGFKPIAARLWSQSGLGPSDVDVVQLYDNFSGPAVAALIDHGFCSFEEAGDFFTVENLTAPRGRLPINTSGGLLAEGNAHGMNTALEGLRQMRNESVNLVPGARACLVTSGPQAPVVGSVLLGPVGSL